MLQIIENDFYKTENPIVNNYFYAQKIDGKLQFRHFLNKTFTSPIPTNLDKILPIDFEHGHNLVEVNDLSTLSWLKHCLKDGKSYPEYGTRGIFYLKDSNKLHKIIQSVKFESLGISLSLEDDSWAVIENVSLENASFFADECNIPHFNVFKGFNNKQKFKPFDLNDQSLNYLGKFNEAQALLKVEIDLIRLGKFDWSKRQIFRESILESNERN